MPSVFIDGEAGTTGLKIRERLEGGGTLRIRSLPEALRKNPEARQSIMADVDIVVLCLPDEAAREAVALADALGASAPRLLDASTAHRTAAGWTYGFAELTPSQPAAIASAKRVSNPGCYATAAIALLRPLVERNILPRDQPVSINAISGYSGGGRAMIEAHEASGGPAFELYGLGLGHKHVPEIMAHAGLTTRPIFVPSVGHFRQGMLLSIPLHLDMLGGGHSAGEIEAVLRQHYAGSRYVGVHDLPESGTLEPQALNDTDVLELFVAGRDGQTVLIARLDNLGKGAAGAAVQNLNLMVKP